MKLFCNQCSKIFNADDNSGKNSAICPECQAEIPIPEHVPGPGVVIGDFLIEKTLSNGGMGEVFIARQISLDRPVALKVLLKEYTGDKEYVESLYREARAAAKINHPNIVQAYAVGEDDGVFYFAMELIRGETLKSILKREGVLEFSRAAKIIRDIASALDTAWNEQKLVHQDIKPDNIMMAANGDAKLADLGLAKTGNSEVDDDSDEVLGTPQYISPEQLTGVPTDVRSDIYSLGATFFQFVTGRFPYVAPTAEELARMHDAGNLEPPKSVNPKVPEELNRIIMKMMARRLEDRYQSAGELVQDLDKFLTAPEAKKSYKKVLITATVLAVFVLCGAGVWFFRDDLSGILKSAKKDTAEVVVNEKKTVAEEKVPEPEKEKIREEYQAKVAEIENFYQKHPGRSDELLSLIDRHWKMLAAPENDLERSELEKVLKIFIPLDEAKRVISGRGKLRRIHLEKIEKIMQKRAEEARAKQAAQEEQERIRLEKIRAEREIARMRIAEKRRRDQHLADLKKQLNFHAAECIKSIVTVCVSGQKNAEKEVVAKAEIFAGSLFGTTDEEKQLINKFKQFLQDIPAGIKETEMVFKKILALSEEDGIRFFVDGKRVTLVSIKMQKISCRKNGELIEFDLDKAPDRAANYFFNLLNRRLKIKNSEFFVKLLLLKNIDKNITPDGFWKKHRDILSGVLAEMGK